MKLFVACVLVLAPTSLFGSLGSIEFSNSTGKKILVFTKFDNGSSSGGSSNFALKPGETHTIKGGVVWGWRYDPSEGKGRNTDRETRCKESIVDNESSKINIARRSECYID
ncbi:MAG: hypothetical protein NTV70_12075 [Acidobacteria bacterium]|nr:hypothetical protein [Acidobacteriota bacterium]